MSFDCKTSNVYFNSAEFKHLKRFETANIKESHIYTNAKGEKRMPTRFWWPKGWINELTVYYPGVLEDGGRLFHTPLATLTDSKKVRVSYKDMATGEHASCDSSEWLKWMGNDPQVEFYDGAKPNPYMENYIKAQKANIANMVAAKRTAEEYDEETKPTDDPKWKKVKGRKN